MKPLASLNAILLRNWREKMVSLAIAVLIWYLIKSHAVVRRPMMYDIPNLPVSGQL
ncbi:MAG: hypothetical protein KDK99_04760 [Verrucomicrobiales bacterium]|nr:hypothetical protein [Verrucomicrobiales bacterium]